MDISYDYYRIFYHVAKYGSISQAAKALNRGQPNITKAMQNLENQLGCKLFVRSSRGVQLTPEGEKLCQHLTIAFEHVVAAEREILAERNLESGTVSIATTEIALHGAVLPALAAFSADYPKVKIKIHYANNRRTLELLKNGMVDFGVLTTCEDADASCRVTIIRRFRELLCIREGEDCAGDLSVLWEYPYISCNSDTHTYRDCQSYLASQGLERKPDMEVANVSHVLQLVKAGIGVGFVSEPIAAEWIKNGAIREIPLQCPPLKRELCLIEDKSRSLSIAAKTLITYFK